MNKFKFWASSNERAQATKDKLEALFGNVSAEDAEAIIVLGGDGTMLEAMHETLVYNVPVYGLNFGSVGFLMNPSQDIKIETLAERVVNAHKAEIHPLRMIATDKDGHDHEAVAFNEVSLFRQNRHAAKMRISVNDEERISELVCDGALVSTPAGSTAYNFSAGGQILPLDANVIALTAISAFRPRRWKGALLPETVDIDIEINEPDHRPVGVTADFKEVRDVVKVSIHQSKSICKTLLFDPDHALGDRILHEQFIV